VLGKRRRAKKRRCLRPGCRRGGKNQLGEGPESSRALKCSRAPEYENTQPKHFADRVAGDEFDLMEREMEETALTNRLGNGSDVGSMGMQMGAGPQRGGGDGLSGIEPIQPEEHGEGEFYKIQRSRWGKELGLFER